MEDSERTAMARMDENLSLVSVPWIWLPPCPLGLGDRRPLGACVRMPPNLQAHPPAVLVRLEVPNRAFHRSAGREGAREQGRKQGGREVERILSIIVLHITVKTRPGRQSAQDLSKDSKRCSMSGLHRRARRSAENPLKDIRAA